MRNFFGELQRHHRQEWGGNFAKTRRSIEATFSSSSLSRNSPTVFFFPQRAIQCARVLDEHGSQKAGFTLRKPVDHFHYGQLFLAKLRWQLDLSNSGKLWEWECGVDIYNSLPLVCYQNLALKKLVSHWGTISIVLKCFWPTEMAAYQKIKFLKMNKSFSHG